MAETMQFCVGLENKPGTLTRLCETLRSAEVNIDALFVSNEAEVAWVNLVLSPIEAAEQTLADAGYKYFADKVLSLRVENRPGEIERIARRLADAGVNINYIYGSATAGSPSTVVLSVDDLDKAGKALTE